MTRNEFIDVVRNNVTLNCKLPYTLGNDNIERILEFDAKPYFYRMCHHALRRTHYYVDLISMQKNLRTATKIIQLPQEIESITWIYLVNYNDMHNLGVMMANSNLSLGLTSVPYVSHLSMSDWGTTTAVMQNIGDSLAHFSKNTIDHYFDPNTKLLEILTSTSYNMVLKVYARIPEEYLFEDPYFIKYVSGMAMMDYATELTFADVTLAGNIKLQSDRIYSRGEALVTEVKEHIKSLNKVGYFTNKGR